MIFSFYRGDQNTKNLTIYLITPIYKAELELESKFTFNMFDFFKFRLSGAHEQN